eukprot:5116889-Prymnesium_polylepis.1
MSVIGVPPDASLGVVTAYFGLNAAARYASGHMGLGKGGDFSVVERARQANVSVVAFVEVGNKYAHQVCQQHGLRVLSNAHLAHLHTHKFGAPTAGLLHTCAEVEVEHLVSRENVQDKRASWHGAKVTAFLHSPFEYTVYLDSDTVVCERDMGATLRRGSLR